MRARGSPFRHVLRKLSMRCPACRSSMRNSRAGRRSGSISGGIGGIIPVCPLAPTSRHCYSRARSTDAVAPGLAAPQTALRRGSPWARASTDAARFERAALDERQGRETTPSRVPGARGARSRAGRVDPRGTRPAANSPGSPGWLPAETTSGDREGFDGVREGSVGERTRAMRGGLAGLNPPG
jgi:hypothetical protein